VSAHYIGVFFLALAITGWTFLERTFWNFVARA
jgi:hypothetical protein